MKTIKSIELQIEELEREKDKIQAEHDELKSLTVEQRVAEYLHGQLCHENHTDGCSWYYEEWENVYKSYAHRDYLAQAMLMLEDYTENEIMDFMDILGTRLSPNLKDFYVKKFVNNQK